jgi:eukaryotic translation initiation factor 2C
VACLTNCFPDSNYGPPQLEESVTALEGRLIKATDVSNVTKRVGGVQLGTSATSKSKEPMSEAFPVRPAFGTAGAKVIVWANYYPIQVKQQTYFKYAVTVTERSSKEGAQAKEVKGRKLYLVMEKILQHLATQDAAIASEYKSQLVSTKKLVLEANPFCVEVPFDPEKGQMDVFDVKLSEPTEASMTELLKYLETQDRELDPNVFPRYPECIDAINVVMGFGPRARADQISPVGSARFFPFAGKDASPKELIDHYRPLVALRGFFQSTRIATGRLLLNANVTCGVFKMSGPLIGMFDKLGLKGVSDPRFSFQSTIRAAVKVLAKTRVLVTFMLSNGKTVQRMKTLHGFASPSKMRRGKKDNPKVKPPRFTNPNVEYPGPQQVEFWMEDSGRYVSVADHFKSSE